MPTGPRRQKHTTRQKRQTGAVKRRDSEMSKGPGFLLTATFALGAICMVALWQIGITARGIRQSAQPDAPLMGQVTSSQSALAKTPDAVVAAPAMKSVLPTLAPAPRTAVPATPGVCGPVRDGYANSRIISGNDTLHVMSVDDCRRQCSDHSGCTCWSWKNDGSCRIGSLSTFPCQYVGSPDDLLWKHGSCRESQPPGALVAQVQMPRAIAAQSVPPVIAGVASSKQPPISKDGKECAEVREGYANKVIKEAVEHKDVKTANDCRGMCLDTVGCTCWSWKDDFHCSTGVSDACSYVGSKDDGRWKYSSCFRDSPLPTVPNSHNPPHPSQIPVLMICHARPKYLRRALDALFKHRTDKFKFPITASQDGEHYEVYTLLQDFVKKGQLARHLMYRGNLGYVVPKVKPNLQGYHKLARHYRWAFDQMFEVIGYAQLLVLEEDLEIAPDFFSYFAAMLPILKGDPELFCISAWNDNGRAEVASNASAVYRTDFFPGLGWMLLRPFWFEVREHWPEAYWDDRLRRRDVRKGRHCIRPEVSRTYTFGEQGVSKGQYYKKFLAKTVLNSASVNWSAIDLSYLSNSSSFDQYLSQQVMQATRTTMSDAVSKLAPGRSLAVHYENATWVKHAKFFGELMEDDKDGIKRGTYRAVLPLTWRGSRLFLFRDWPAPKEQEPAQPSG